MKLVTDFNEYQILDMSEGMKLETWNGKELLRFDDEIVGDAKVMVAENKCSCEISLANKLMLWDMENPNLYDLHIKLLDGVVETTVEGVK